MTKAKTTRDGLGPQVGSDGYRAFTIATARHDPTGAKTPLPIFSEDLKENEAVHKSGLWGTMASAAGLGSQFGARAPPLLRCVKWARRTSLVGPISLRKKPRVAGLS
jgi:hypothetical protein